VGLIDLNVKFFKGGAKENSCVSQACGRCTGCRGFERPIRTSRHAWFDKRVTVKESMKRRWFDRTSCRNICGTADFISGSRGAVFGEGILRSRAIGNPCPQQLKR
jgi:hypothetical protein